MNTNLLKKVNFEVINVALIVIIIFLIIGIIQLGKPLSKEISYKNNNEKFEDTPGVTLTVLETERDVDTSFDFLKIKKYFEDKQKEFNVIKPEDKKRFVTLINNIIHLKNKGYKYDINFIRRYMEDSTVEIPTSTSKGYIVLKKTQLDYIINYLYIALMNEILESIVDINRKVYNLIDNNNQLCSEIEIDEESNIIKKCILINRTLLDSNQSIQAKSHLMNLYIAEIDKNLNKYIKINNPFHNLLNARIIKLIKEDLNGFMNDLSNDYNLYYVTEKSELEKYQYTIDS